AGLDGAAVLERRGSERSGQCSGGRPVYNIETGTGNYIAGSLLVHNCHNIKSATAKRRYAVKRIAASAQLFVALSGTPITRDTADLWTTLDILTPGAWPSRERWVHRYCLTTFDEYREYVLGLN